MLLHLALLSFAIAGSLAQLLVDYRDCSIVCNANGTCHVDHPKALQCRLCGPDTGAEPYRCLAANATFDGIAANEPVPAFYNDVSFSGLTIARAPTNNPVPITPSSHNQYARTASGGAAVLSFPANPPNTTTPYLDWGELFNFAFGCADATDSAAAPCTLSLTSYCANVSLDNENATYYAPYTVTFDYAPKSAQGAGMDVVAWPYPPPAVVGWEYTDFCPNYTFVAVGGKGKDVVLYLDSVAVNHWWYLDLDR